MSHGQSCRSQQVQTFLLTAALAIVTLLVYCRCLEHRFIGFDDEYYVTENPQRKAGLTSGGVHWAFTTFACANWHPLTWLSLQLDTTLYGGNSSGYHLTNVLLHTASVVSLFSLLSRMTGMVWRSAVVACLFAL